MQIIADMHTHTVVSGHAYSTLQENLKAASERGLRFVATTEHGPALLGGPNIYYFSNMRVLPERLYGVRLIKGVEANILNQEGELDLPERFLARLEYVAVGLHDDCFMPGSVEENTAAVLAALRNPLVDAIVHPGNPKYPIDFVRVLEAAAEAGAAVEINNSSLLGSRKGSCERCKEVASLAAQHKCTVVLGSDAHWSGDVGRLDDALALAIDAGVPPSNILNLSEEAIGGFLEQRLARKLPARTIAIK